MKTGRSSSRCNRKNRHCPALSPTGPTVFVSGEYGMTKLMLKDPGGSTGDASADLALAALGKTLSPEGWYRSWMVTAGATYRWGGYSPLDQGHAKADQLRSQERQTDLEMEDLVRDVKLEVQHGLLKLVSSSSAILSQKENIESAEESSPSGDHPVQERRDRQHEAFGR